MGENSLREPRTVVEQAASAVRKAFRDLATRLREETCGRVEGESADLIREDRDRRCASGVDGGTSLLSGRSARLRLGIAALNQSFGQRGFNQEARRFCLTDASL